jgi:hypothetical protein
MARKRSIESLMERLELEKSTFDDDAHPLLRHQQDAFQLCCDLLRDNPMSQTQKSTKHRYSRLRARTFLLDVFTGLGADVFLLCTLAVSITDLSKISHKSTFPTLREWWKTALHPRGLTEVANEICAANSIGTLATPPKKRQSPEDLIGVPVPFIPHVIHMLTEPRIHLRASVSNRSLIR